MATECLGFVGSSDVRQRQPSPLAIHTHVFDIGSTFFFCSCTCSTSSPRSVDMRFAGTLALISKTCWSKLSNLHR